MNILPNIEIKGLSLFIDNKVLVIADLHIGVEEKMQKQGILIPLFQFNDLYKQIKELLKLKPEVIIINGDLKQEFGKISDQEWRDTLKILDLLTSNCKKVILVKGNHDTILGPIAKKRNVEILDKYRYKDILFIHGNKKIETDAKTIIIGHIHPSVGLKEGRRIERYKCFMKGKYNDKNLIVLPAFSKLREGIDILNQEFISPYIQEINDFEIFVVGDKIYNFGKAKDIKF